MALEQIQEYCPCEDEEYMSKRQVEYFKNKLIEWRCEVEVAASGFLTVLKETSMRKPDQIEASSTHMDISLDFQARSRRQQLLEQIDYALARIEEGEYGYCEITGEEIGLKRLLARPVATMCVDAQERYERMSTAVTRIAFPCVV